MKESLMPDYEWHTKDPITGELFYIIQGGLFSQIGTQIKHLLNLQNESKGQEITDQCPNVKFSPINSGKSIQIFGGDAVATLDSDTHEDYAVVTNINPVGIVSIEFICPISCANLSFGMCSLDNITKVNFKSFKNSSRRKVLMEINYTSRNVAFYLDGEFKDKSFGFAENAVHPCICIEKKSTAVILNPKVSVVYPNITKGFLKKMLIFRCPKVELKGRTLSQYFNENIDYKGDVNVIGEIIEGKYLNEFLCCIFSTKDDMSAFMKNLTPLTITNAMVLLNVQEKMEIEKKIVSYISLTLSGKNVKIRQVIQKNEEGRNDPSLQGNDSDYKGKIVAYLINSYNSIEFYHDCSVEKINQLKKEVLKGNDNVMQMEHLNKNVTNKITIDYIPYNDSLLVVNKNSMKIIKREPNGLFDYAAIEDLSLCQPNEIKIIISLTDLHFLINKLDWKFFLNSMPSISKFKQVKHFLDSIPKGIIIDKSKTILSIHKGDILFFKLQSFLNLFHLITKEHKKIRYSHRSGKESLRFIVTNENETCENQELLGVLPFSMDEEKTVTEEIKFDKYEEYLVPDSMEFMQLQAIVNRICEQLIMRGKQRTIYETAFSAYENLSSFINYPFTKGQDTSLFTDKGFYVENAFTNELKLHGYEEKLLNVEDITNEEMMRKYFNYNFPSNLINTPLRDYHSVIPSYYSINSKPYALHMNTPQNLLPTEEKNTISLYNISNTRPLLITFSKNGECNIWNTQLGLRKLGSVNVLKGIETIETFNQIPEVFWVRNDSKLKSINDIFDSKNYDITEKAKEEVSSTGISSLPNQGPPRIDKKDPVVISQENLNNLYSMGFSMKICQEALEKHQNNFSKALDYLLEYSQNNEEKINEVMKTGKIGSWQCSKCTFMNEKGTKDCEMCETAIPEELLKQFEPKTITETTEEKPKETTSSPLPVPSIKQSPVPEVNIVEFKDVIVSKIHIAFNNNDPFSPFLLIVILHNIVENTMIVSVYKMMINPIIVKDFFSFGKDNMVTNNIDQRKFPSNDLGVMMKYLNENYFENLHTLYPNFLGTCSSSLKDNYKHLIPIEHSYLKLPMNSIYDSYCIEGDGEVKLIILSESLDNKVNLSEVIISSSKLKYSDIASSSIVFKAKIMENIHKNFNDNDFLTELNVIADKNYTYVLGKNSYMLFKETMTGFAFVEKKHYEMKKTIGLFRRTMPVYDQTKSVIERIEVYDDTGRIITVLVDNSTRNENEKKDENSSQGNKEGEMQCKESESITEISIDKFSENEISYLVKMLDFEKLQMILPAKSDINDTSIKGLIKSSMNNYKTIYFSEDICKEKVIIFTGPSFVIFSNIDLVFNLKAKHQSSLISKGQNISLHKIISTSLSEYEFSSINDFIPLTITDFKGAQSMQTVNVSSMLFNNHRFVSNYPKPEYIFSHIHGKAMEIESVIISSDEKPKSSDIPFGEGLIFLVQNIESINLCKLKYEKFTFEDFTSFYEAKIANGEDFYEYDPVAYVIMGDSQTVKTNVIKAKKSKYIYFLPTNGRNNGKNFDKQVMSILFFGVQGKIDSNCDNILTSHQSYINYSLGDKTNVPCKIELYGKTNSDNDYVLLGKKENVEINSVLSNGYLANYYSAKTVINNEYHQDTQFTSVKINIAYDDNEEKLFELSGASCEFNSFKTMTSSSSNETGGILTLPHIKNQFHKMMINSGEFDKFNIKFAKHLSDKSLSNEKRLAILQYLVDIIKKVPLLTNKLEPAIDYYAFITNNILINTTTERLVILSFDFLCSAINNNQPEVIKQINLSFDRILSDIHKTGLSFKGLINFIKLLHLITLDKSTIITRAKETIKFCLNKIQSCTHQPNEHIFLKSYLKFNESPFDKYCFEQLAKISNQSISIEQHNSYKTLESCTVSDIVEDTMSMVIDLKKPTRINKIKLIFTLNETIPVCNFRLNIFSLDSNGDKMELKTFKYYYDHVWKQLTKYDQSKDKKNLTEDNNPNTINDTSSVYNPNAKEMNTMFCTDDYRSLEYSFENEAFDSRYILIELSINDGTKVINDFPAMVIYPLIYGSELPLNTKGNGNISSNDSNAKISKLFSYSSPKKTNVELLGKTFILRQGNDLKKYMIDYYLNGKQDIYIPPSSSITSNSNDIELNNHMTNLVNYQSTLKLNIAEQLKHKDNFDKESFQLKISKTIEDIKRIQTILSNQNNIISFDESLSLNIELIKVLSNECNKLPDINSNDAIDDIGFIMNLITICLFNEIGTIQSFIFDFLNKFVFKYLTKQQHQSLFDKIVEKYLNKDNEYQSIMSNVNIIANLELNIEIIFDELKGAFKGVKWDEGNFKDIFFKTSSLLIILIQKITKDAKIIKNKEAEIIEMTLGFINYLMKETNSISKENINLILFQVLNLLHVCFVNSNKDNRENLSTPNLIQYLIDIVFSLWNNEIVKTKITSIIDILIDPFNLINANDNELPMNSTSYSNNKIILIVQSKTLEFIHNVIDKSQHNGSVLSDDEANKFDYILNLLNKSYSVNTHLSKDTTNADSAEKSKIKSNNSEIIEGFIKVVLKFNHSSKIGFSNANNFWKYLTDILERGNLEMMFYNNNFKKLIIGSFINLDIELQEILFTKFTKAFQTLFLKETVIKGEIYEQVIEVILHILDKYTGTKSEEFMMQFVINLTEIIISGVYGSQAPCSTITQIKLSNEVMTKLFINLSNYLISHLNLISFSGSICGNPIIFQRMSIASNLLYITTLFTNDFFMLISDDQARSDSFRLALRNYLIFLIFNSRKTKSINPPLMVKLVKTWTYANQIITSCVNRRVLIESCLIEIMKIVRKVDDCIFTGIKNGKMAMKNGIKLTNKLFSTLETLLNMFLVDDVITKYFAFELQGFKFFIDRVNSHRQHSLFTSSDDDSARIVQSCLNRELMENVNNDITIKNSIGEIGDEGNNAQSQVQSQSQSQLQSPFIQVKENELNIISNTNLNSKISMLLKNNSNLNLISNNNLIGNTNSNVNTNSSNMYSGSLDKYKKEEFALVGKLNLLEGNIHKDPIINSSINWSSKKKPNPNSVYSREFRESSFYEESFYYELPHLIELKEVLFTINTNLVSAGDKITGNIPIVILECGATLDKMDICVKLDRINDQQYEEKMILAFGFNFYSNIPDMIKSDDNYLENLLEQLINCRARYFKFIVRRPIILSNKNTHVAKVSSNIVSIAINCISLYGAKLVNTQKVIEFIQDKEKNCSIKIISKMFTAEFIDTLRYIAQDSTIIDNIKQIYNAFEPYISSHASILSNILINVSKYNYELGEWLLNRLLNVDNSEIHAKLAVEITQNNPEYVNDRLNKFINFIFNSLAENSPMFFAHDSEQKIKNVGKFIKFFTLTLNGLLISPFTTKAIQLQFDFSILLSLIQHIQKYALIRKEVLSFITMLLLPHKTVNINNVSTPENTLTLLINLYEEHYIYDYLDIISILVCDSKEYEGLFIKKDLVKYFCEQFLSQVQAGIRGKNMLNLMNILKNMSFSKNFVKKIREKDYDFKILDIIKNKNEKSDSILINNNIVFLNNLVIFIRNCINDYPDYYAKLAIILINDLEVCKKKIDKAYANNVLMPLLRIEKAVNVCIQPLDSVLKMIYSSYCNFSSDLNNNANANSNSVSSTEKNHMDYSSLMNNYDKLIGESNPKEENIFIPTNLLSHQTEVLLKEHFTKFINDKYQGHPMQTKLNSKSPLLNWKMVASLQKKSEIANDVTYEALSRKGAYMYILQHTTKPKLHTVFYLDASLVNVNQYNLVYPFSNKNFIMQLEDETKHILSTFTQANIYGGTSSDLASITHQIDVNIMNIAKINLKGEKSSEMLLPKNISTISTNQIGSFAKGTINDYEVFYLNLDDDSFNNNASDKDEITTLHKITPVNYIDETGNLSLQLIKQCKYYKENHPLFSIRNNPIFEFPSNIKIKNIKSLVLCEKIELRELKTGKVLEDDVELDKIISLNEGNNIIDVYYDIQSLRGVAQPKEEKSSTAIVSYEPVLPVLKAFEGLGGIRKIVSVLQNSIKKWKNKEIIAYWLQWIDDVNKFSELPSFFSSLIRHQKCFNIIFNLLCGLYDNSTSAKEIGIDASKYIYEILDNSFIESQSVHLRQIAIDNGIFKSILDRLQLLTLEKPRKYLPGDEKKETKEVKQEVKTESKTKGKKGVGYGSDQTGDNEVWDVNSYLEGRRANSLQIASIIKLLTNFFDSREMKMDNKLMNVFLTSPILPCLESAYRGGTLLELAKDDILYYAYLSMTIRLSQNSSLIPLLLDISKDYKPVQTQSVYTLLSLLHDGAKIFKNCLKNGQNTTKTIEEKLSIEIINTFDEVTKNIKAYQTHLDMGKNYMEILKLPMEKSYPLLLRELSFDYMNMRENSVMKHYYSSSSTGDASATKMIRLAQEYADLSRSLPCESTNSIYVRVDKNNMDFMKVLIMGSEGTPYSNGAFEYDVYFDSQYPNSPPKVNLMTTGGGSTRFNPNLYQNGKVCLSLLGTWRGKSTENWDPKISTLLQVLISIQSIIMSDLIYFNEPSCEGEMGKPEGEAKNEAYSNIVRYANIKYAIIEQIQKPSKGFEEVIRRHFYLKKAQILKEAKGWIERSKTAEAKYASFSYDHNSTWANKMNQPKAYTKMMEDIYVELEKVLNDLPLPSDLQKKTEDEKIALEKKTEKMEFVSLDNVDVGYDNSVVIKKEINLNDDAVKDRWSRYIGAMGIDAVQRQANANVFLSGASGLGIEIAKNIVLSGCKKFILHDIKKTTYYDLSSQFFLSEEDIGYNRAEASLKKLQQLNYYVKILSSAQPLPVKEKELDAFGMKDFSIVILTECDYNTMIAINAYCRKRNIAFIAVDVHGTFARLINDFGDKFAISDKDGEELKEVMIKSLTNDTEGIITVLDGTRHEYSDGDEVIINEVEGMDLISNSIEESNISKGINGMIYKVKVLSPQQFTIGDTKSMSKYIRNGIAKQVKTKTTMEFISIDKCLESKQTQYNDDNMLNADFTKISHCNAIQIGFEAIDHYLSDKKLLHSPWDVSDAEDVIKIALKSMNISEFDAETKKLLYYITFTYMTQFAPLCAYMGGIAAQEAIKAITGKFTPIKQVMYYDTIEVLPEIDISKINESVKAVGYQCESKRTDGLKVILGAKTMTSISQMKVLVVGAGAIGCEILKNYAMLNVGTKDNGAIYITDPDIIEVSNLNRQFLFREKHLRLPKSSTAAAAVIQMNKGLKNHIFAKLDKVCEESEGIFTDNFFLSLNAVTNALDNITARRYVDSRCVANRIPLLESGTLGPKGHVQVILPFKTESYSSQNDPEVSNDIPQCTLKMFPEEAIHCVEWARDQFGKIFTQLPKMIMKTIEEKGEGSEMKVIKKTVKYLSNIPKTFDDCIRIAREKFNKAFCNNIKQLLFAYPLDKKDKSGKLFWSLPKRPPVSVIYDPNDDLCANFIGAYASLLANQFSIKNPYAETRAMTNKKDMAKKAMQFKMEDFKPNELKAKEIEKEVEKEGKKETEEENVIEKEEEVKPSQNEEELTKQIKSLCHMHTKTKFISEEFEKDNDLNYHIDLIYAMSALRCRNYKLEEMDWMKVKIKAGRIIPALATTTASIAALQSIELVKIAKEDDLANYRNSFLNLAISYLQSAEPGPCKKVTLREGLTTNLWDRWEISLSNDKQNLKSLFEILNTKYWLYPRDCFKGKKAIYSMAAYADKKDLSEEIMNKNLLQLLGISKEEKYVDLLITFTKDDKSQEYLKEIPKIRVHLSHQ